MITDLFSSFIIATFMVYGFSRPHVALASVVWVDTISPQLISSSFLSGMPLSLTMTLFFFLTLVLNTDKISAPRQKTPLVMLLLFIVWMTISTKFAHHPDLAEFKYGIVVKILFLSAFIPYVINDRFKAECFLWIFQVSVGFYLQLGGLKVLGGGGGYSVDVVQTTAKNSGITETSTLSIMAALSIPLLVYLYRYSLFARKNRLAKFYILVTGVSAVFCIIGTFARTGLVAGAFVTFMFFLTSEKRVRFGFLMLTGVLLIIPLLPDGWIDRMNTIKNPDEDRSALGRIVVWRWTIDFAAENPFLGGGFYAYLDNLGELQNYAGEGESYGKNEKAKAFHNIVFEVLGEHGYIGLFIYLSIVYTSVRGFWSLRKAHVGDDWFHFLAVMLLIAIMTYFVGGMFVAIAYNPWLFYLLFLGVSLVNIDRLEVARS